MIRAAALFFAVLLLSFCMRAQTPACTTVSGTLYANGASGGPVPLNATLFVSQIDVTPAGGYSVSDTQVKLTVTNGVVSTCLVPGYYEVAYQVPGPLGTATARYTRYWSIATTSAVTVAQIESKLAPPSSYADAVARFPKPPTQGTYCIVSSNGIMTWGTCPNSTTHGATWIGLGIGATWPSKQWNSL